MITNSQTATNMNYVLGSAPLVINIANYFSPSNPVCAPLDLNFLGPTWMVYNSQTMTLTISTSDVTKVGTHSVELTAKTFRLNSQMKI